MEKLHELVEEGGFDVVVVDTPPSRNALDFLDAPRRLTHFLENRIFQALMAPTRVGLRFMGVAAQALLRTIAKVAGADIVHDAVAFFQAFEGMEEGFRTAGRPGTRTPGPAGHRIRAGRLPPARLGGRGRPLRRQARRVGACRPPRWSSTGCSPGSPPTTSSTRLDPVRGSGRAPCRRTRRGTRRPGGQPGRLHPRLRPRGGGLRRRWWPRSPPPPSTGSPCSTPTSTTSPAWPIVADLLFGQDGAVTAPPSGPVRRRPTWGHRSAGALTSGRADHPRGQ